MEVRLLRPINHNPIGKRLTVDDGVAELWIMQRKAERVIEPTEVEAMVPGPPTKGRSSARKGKTSKMVA